MAAAVFLGCRLAAVGRGFSEAFVVAFPDEHAAGAEVECVRVGG